MLHNGAVVLLVFGGSYRIIGTDQEKKEKKVWESISFLPVTLEFILRMSGSVQSFLKITDYF